MRISKLIQHLQTASAMLTLGATHLQSPLLLLIRLYWGWSFFQTGWGKLQTHDEVSEFFTTLNIPMPGFSAWMAGATECFGGLLLLVGLGSRFISIPLIFTMLVAYLTADLEVVQNIFAEPDKFTAADPFLFLLASAIVLAFGPGFFSLDRLLAWLSARGQKSEHAAPLPEPTAVAGAH